MTVKELRKALSGLPSDAEVYVVRDWETVDEWGNLDDLAEVADVHTQQGGGSTPREPPRLNL